VSFRYAAGFNKPGFNPLATQTSTFYSLYSWGSNANGALGLGNATYYSSPKQIGSLNTWAAVVGGSSSGVALKLDGTLWTWGYNVYGQLGLGNTSTYSSPKQVGTLTNWQSISAGNGTTTAVKTNGTLWAWGRNSYGQLGSGNITNYSSPIQVGLLTTWAYVCSGDQYTLATKTDGTLWAWGRNNSGQLGLGNTTNYSSPKQVGALTNWNKFTKNGSGEFNVVIKTDGTLWTWGANWTGQLGLGNTTYYSSPKQVGALTTWSVAGGGDYFGNAVKTDGTFWSWGYGVGGRLGLSNETAYSSPKQVGALTTWLLTSGSYGANFSVAIKTDSTLWVWGNNGAGQLGLGNITAYSSPKQVGSGTWGYATNASNSTFALK